MKSSEKAKYLFETFHYQICNDNGINENDSNIYCAKQCAIICVEQILDAIIVFHNGPEWGLVETLGWQYWNKVKEEIYAL